MWATVCCMTRRPLEWETKIVDVAEFEGDGARRSVARDGRGESERGGIHILFCLKDINKVND